jgi:hypothetical protein
VENFGWNFSANDYSVPEGAVLSSAAMVTAAETVQKIESPRSYEVPLEKPKWSVRRRIDP